MKIIELANGQYIIEGNDFGTYYPPRFDSLAEAKAQVANIRRQRRNANARAKRDAYASLGLKRVRGSLGGVYYE